MEVNEFIPIQTLTYKYELQSIFFIAGRLSWELLETKIIVLTMHKAEHIYNAVIDEGARGYILKENSVEDLVEGIKISSQGDLYISPTIHHFRDNRKKFKKQHNFDSISDAEWRVLVKTAEGLSNQ